jgi:hypothetical protein
LRSSPPRERCGCVPLAGFHVHAAVGAKDYSFALEHSVLPAGEDPLLGESSVTLDHAMTWQAQIFRHVAHRRAHGPRRAGPTREHRHESIARDLSSGDLRHHAVDICAEGVPL